MATKLNKKLRSGDIFVYRRQGELALSQRCPGGTMSSNVNRPLAVGEKIYRAVWSQQDFFAREEYVLQAGDFTSTKCSFKYSKEMVITWYAQEFKGRCPKWLRDASRKPFNY